MQPELSEDARSVEAIRRLMTELCKALTALAEGVAKAAPDVVRALLVRRADVLPSIDERLVKVAELLRRGLRDEAIGYAAEPPDLVQAATLLDLSSNPRWELWRAALTEQIIPEPPMPRMDLVANLVQAQSDVVRFKPLLDTWRRMNLANNPLGDRIGMLRKFREVDPANELWFETLREHQKQRLMELERDIRAAASQRDEARLSSMVEEMQQDWIEPVPARLKAAAATALEKFRGSRIDRDLDEVVATLVTAYEGRDLDAARELRQRWQSLVDEKGALAADDPRLQAAIPAIEWVDNHDRMREVSEEIWASLDSRPGGMRARREWVRSLGRLGNEMEDLAEKLPGEVDGEAIERGHERIARVREALERDEGFRRKLMYIGLGSGAAILAAAVWYVDDQMRFKVAAEAAAREVAGMQAAVASGTSMELPDFERKWPQRVVSDPVVASKIAAARVELRTQDDRRRRLAAAVAQLEKSRQLAEQAERRDPLATWPTAFSDATRTLAEIGDGRLAVTDQEQAEVTRAVGAIDRLRRRFIGAADAEIRERVKVLDADLDRARATLSKDRPAAKQLLESASAGIAALRGRADAQAAPDSSKDYAGLRMVSPDQARFLASDGPLAKKAASLDEMLTTRERFDNALARLDSNLGDWAAYGAELETISTTFKELVEASDYGRAAERAQQWAAIDDWRRFVASLPQLDRASPASAAQVTAAFKALPEPVTSLPMARRFARDVMPAIGQLADRDMDALRADLSRWFAGTWLGDLKFLVITDEDGPAQYYSLSPVAEGAAKFDAVVGPKSQDGVWPLKTVRSTVVAARPSPQSILSEKLLKLCEPQAFPSRGLAFDQWVVTAVKQTLAADKVDPLIRVLAARKCLLLASDLSRPVREAGRPFLTALDDGEGNVSGISADAFWSFLAPGQAEYLLVAPKAKRLLDTIRDGLPAIEAAIDRERAVLIQPAPEIPKLVGRLGRNANGDVVAVWKSGSPKPGAVWCVGVGAEFFQAGTVDATGRFSSAEKPGPAGTPLYVMEALPAGASPTETDEKAPDGSR
jgi:hypothetical protein